MVDYLLVCYFVCVLSVAGQRGRGGRKDPAWRHSITCEWGPVGESADRCVLGDAQDAVRKGGVQDSAPETNCSLRRSVVDIFLESQLYSQDGCRGMRRGSRGRL